MSILTDLKAERSRLVAGADMVIVPGRTLDALIAVAEAVDKGKLTAARHSLYPLVKEADDERTA